MCSEWKLSFPGKIVPEPTGMPEPPSPEKMQAGSLDEVAKLMQTEEIQVEVATHEKVPDVEVATQTDVATDKVILLTSCQRNKTGF